jgi:hypothetical protein
MRSLIFLLLVISASAQTFKEYDENSSDFTTSTTITATGTMNVASGDLVVACVAMGSATTTAVLGVSDGGSNSMTCLAGSGGDATVGAVTICYKENATANATASWTATYDLARPYRWIGVANYSGMATASVVDAGPTCNVAGCNSATTGTDRTASNLTTTQANTLLLACSYDNNGNTWTMQNSFNARAGTSGQDAMLADKSVSSTGSYPAGNFATVGSSAGYVSSFAAFKVAGGAPPPLRRRRPITQ